MTDDLRALGETLRQAREARALSLEEVEAQTRIRRKYLEAFERGDFNELPSAAHAKGFLRNYAQSLLLNPDEIVGRFSALTGGGPPAPAAPPVPAETDAAPSGAGDRLEETQPLPAPPEAAQRTPGASYITADKRVGPSGPRGLESPSMARPTPALGLPRPAISTPVEPSPAAPAAEEPAPQANKRTGAGKTLPAQIIGSDWFAVAFLIVGFLAVGGWILWQTNQSRTAASAAPEPAETPGTDAAAQTDASTTAEPASEAAPLPEIPATGSGVALVIDASQRSWVRVTADGDVVYEGQAAPGNVLRYEAAQAITLFASNAGGVSVSFNGVEIGALGQRGEAVEWTFRADGGIETPTPTPAPTPTFGPVEGQ